MPTILAPDPARGRFDRALLPPARLFYEGEFGPLRPDRKDFAKARCPFHISRSGRKSLSVNLKHGGFNCFSCNTKGDMVRFVMLRDGCDFRTACRRLGAWEEECRGPRNPSDCCRARPGRLIMDFSIDGVLYRASRIDNPRDYRDSIKRFFHAASDRLMELGPGESAEHDRCWEDLALAFAELRELDDQS